MSHSSLDFRYVWHYFFEGRITKVLTADVYQARGYLLSKFFNFSIYMIRLSKLNTDDDLFTKYWRESRNFGLRLHLIIANVRRDNS